MPGKLSVINVMEYSLFSHPPNLYYFLSCVEHKKKRKKKKRKQKMFSYKDVRTELSNWL